PLRPSSSGQRGPVEGAQAEGRRPNRLIEVSLLGRVRMPLSPEGTPAHPGVVAPAEALVSCDNPELADLPAQLLGRTLIVRDLAGLRARGTAPDEQAAAQEEEITVLAEQAADLRARLERHRDRRQGLHEEVQDSQDQIRQLEREAGELEQSWRAARDQATAAE